MREEKNWHLNVTYYFDKTKNWSYSVWTRNKPRHYNNSQRLSDFEKLWKNTIHFNLICVKENKFSALSVVVFPIPPTPFSLIKFSCIQELDKLHLLNWLRWSDTDLHSFNEIHVTANKMQVQSYLVNRWLLISNFACI